MADSDVFMSELLTAGPWRVRERIMEDGGGASSRPGSETRAGVGRVEQHVGVSYAMFGYQ